MSIANNTVRTVFLYSGQGSHYRQMGAALYERNATFRAEMLRLDQMARDMSGIRVLDELYQTNRKKSDRFDRTLHTHAAIFMVEHAMTQAFKAAGVRPNYLLSSSLGTFAATVEAGCLTVEQALEAVLTQAKVFESHCPTGGMIALLDKAQSWIEGFAKDFDCEVVATNQASPSVIAAESSRISAAETMLRKLGVVYQRLAVSHAFHTRWIDAAEKPFRDFLRGLSVRLPRIPIACCASGSVLHSISGDIFWEAARRPIQFEQVVPKIGATEKLRFVDLGPSGSLATALKHWARRHSIEIEAYSVLSPFGKDDLRFDQTANTLLSF